VQFATRLILIVGFMLTAVAGGHATHAMSGTVSASASEVGAHHPHIQSSAVLSDHHEAGMQVIPCSEDDDGTSGGPGDPDCCASGCSSLQFTVAAQNDVLRPDRAALFQSHSTSTESFQPDLLHRPPET
jgi:hypothetical protein